MYGKLFASLYQGTLRGRANEILVFTNLIAHAGPDGVVDKHWRAIAEEVGIGVEDVKKAIEALEAPDPESRSPEADGARLIRLDGHRAWGWVIVNHAKYRSIRDEAERREYMNRYMSDYRKKKGECDQPKGPVNSGKLAVNSVNFGKPPLANTEAESDSDSEAERKKEAVLSLPPNGEPDPNLIPFAPRSEPLGDAIPKIAALHAVWQELTGQPAVRLDQAAERRWFEFIRAGWGEPELRLVVDSIQRGITRRERNRGALRLSNLIDPTQFNEELGMATAAPKPKPRAPEPEKPPVKVATPEELARWAAQMKADREKLAGHMRVNGPTTPEAPEPTTTSPAPTLPPDVLAALQAAQERNRCKTVTV